MASLASDSEAPEEHVPGGSSLPETHGAPVETGHPLGRELTLFSATNLDLGRILGAGIFSTPGSILNSYGSVGLSLLSWIIAPILSAGQVMIYTELAAMFPDRSGGEVVYLEQAYPKPKFLIPVAMAVSTVLTSFSATAAIVFAQYTLTAFDSPVTPFRQSAVAIAVSAFTCLLVAVSTKWSLKVVNAFSIFKVLSLALLAGTGLAVLTGFTHIKDPYANLRDPFEGSTTNLNGLVNGFVKTNLAFVGGTNAFNLITEVKRGSSPVRVVSRAGYISLALTAVLYFFTNVAYFCAIPKKEIAESGQLVAALFMERVFGRVGFAAKLLPIMVSGSCFGNLIAVTIAHARIVREIARQGLLPFPGFFASTKPFGTPLGPVALKFTSTVFCISILPAKDAFNFLVDFAQYPSYFFGIAIVVGVWILRERRREAGLSPVPKIFKAWNGFVVIKLIWLSLMIILPWVPPEPGQGDVSFWYATYCVAGIGVLLSCGVYYYIWIIVLPRRGGYEVVEETEEQEGGVKLTKLVRHYKELSGETRPLLSSS